MSTLQKRVTFSALAIAGLAVAVGLISFSAFSTVRAEAQDGAVKHSADHVRPIDGEYTHPADHVKTEGAYSHSSDHVRPAGDKYNHPADHAGRGSANHYAE